MSDMTLSASTPATSNALPLHDKELSQSQGSRRKAKHTQHKFGSARIALISSQVNAQRGGADLSAIQGVAGNVFDSAGNCFEGFGSFLEKLSKVVVIKQIAFIAMAPWHLYNFIKSAIGVSEAKTRQVKIDASLQMTDELRALSENVGTFLSGMSALNVISVAIERWSGPFAWAASALSLASIVKNVRVCIRTNRLMREFQQTIKSAMKENDVTMETYQAVLSFIERKNHKHEGFIQSVFGANEDKLADALLEREKSMQEKFNSEDVEKQNEAKEEIKATLKTLRGRIRHNIVTSTISIVAATINFIGTLAILTCPIVPIGWACVGLSGLVDLTRIVNGGIVAHNFAKRIGFKQTFWQAVTS